MTVVAGLTVCSRQSVSKTLLCFQSGKAGIEDTKLADHNLAFDLDNKIYDENDYVDQKPDMYTYYAKNSKGNWLASHWSELLQGYLYAS